MYTVTGTGTLWTTYSGSLLKYTDEYFEVYSGATLIFLSGLSTGKYFAIYMTALAYELSEPIYTHEKVYMVSLNLRYTIFVPVSR